MTAEKTVHIIATSDTHGKMVPWNYEMDQEDHSGSMAQLAAAIRELKDDNTLLVDAGDTIQANCADLFLDEAVHPMIQCMNTIGYDIWVTGNHDYDFGIEEVTKTIRTLNAKTLTGNVYYTDHSPLAPGYAVLEKNGVRIGLIGMTTPVISEERRVQKDGLIITDPMEETEKLIRKLQPETDVLIGVFHMGFGHSINERDTSVLDMAKAFPEFDVIIGGHEHKIVEEHLENGILIVENADQAASLNLITLTFEEQDGNCSLVSKHGKTVLLKDYAPDAELMKAMEPYHRKAKEAVEACIGILEGSALSEEADGDIPEGAFHSNPLTNFLHELLQYYSGAEITAFFINDESSNIHPGPIKRSDTISVIKYPNRLCVLRMSGKQLKKYMEYSAGFFKCPSSEEEPITRLPDRKLFTLDIFGGLDYEINVSRPAGSRIRSLRKTDGTEIKALDSFTVAVTDFRAQHLLLPEDGLFQGEKRPEVVNMNVRPDLESLNEMIIDFIRNVKKGVLRPDPSLHWRVVRR
ncbi:MAG: 5'-nucleotidase C-terminal domain-containing protein [Solobacterium sp.]|nr:5'-nucleotidase C-terminal domain-containing protein [Solobacterium sp.]